MLKVNALHKSFIDSSGKPTPAIQNINLEVKRGEFVALLGPSGCGKSTLLRLMTGLDKPTSGNVEFNNQKIIAPDKKIGMIFQQFTLFPWLTVKENIGFGLLLSDNPTLEVTKIVDRYLNLTGLWMEQNAYPKTLSGGMQQRVAIARTLANNPSVVLLDEPFGSLDVQTRVQMQDFLAQLWQEEQKTMVLVTHDIDEALYLGDTVVVMETRPGRIKEIIKPNLPRPRNPEVKFSPEFVSAKKHLSYIIQSESIKSAWHSTSHKVVPKIKISVNVWPGSGVLYLAKELGYFDEAGLPIQIVNIEKEAERHSAWLSGTVDLLDTTLDSAVLLSEHEPDLKIVLIKDVSYGGDALVVKESIQNFHDLKGKTVAAEVGWVSYFFLLYLLKKHGLSSKDIHVVNMKGSDIGSAVISGKVDAGVLWEPWLSKTLEFSSAHVLADTTTEPILWDCVVAKKRYLHQYPGLSAGLKTVWQKSLKFLREHPQESYKIMSSYVSISQRDLKIQFQKLELIENHDTENIASKIKEIQEVLAGDGLLQKIVAPESLLGD